MSTNRRFFVVVASVFVAATSLAADPTPEAPKAPNLVPAVQPPGTIMMAPSGLPTAFVPPPMVAPPAPKPIIELTTLKLLLAKGTITQEEYDTALKDIGGGQVGQSPTVDIAGWKTTFYGFVQADFMWDSTQSFNDFSGNGQVARPETYAGSHPRFEMSLRNSRFGFRFAPPAWGDIKTSGNFEFDFIGGEGAGAIQNAAATVSEAAFFVNPVLRIRHAWGKIETPIVDILFGQTWDVYGMLPLYLPTIVQWPGLLGEIFARTPQFRVSKTIKTEFVNVDLILAAMRPPQRDAAVPEGQAAARIYFPKWTGWHSGYLTGTSLMPASLSVSGTLRQFAIGAPCTFAAPATTCASTTTNFATGSGIAVSGFIPIIPRTKEDKSNSLNLVGELSSGTSNSDLYTGFTGGIANALPAGQAFTGVIDAGLLAYNAAGELVQPKWLTSLLGLDYTLPGGRATIFVNWSHTQLNNPGDFPSRNVRNHSNMWNGGVTVDVTQQVRMAVDYTRIVDVYNDGVTANNDRVQFVSYFFF